VKDQAKRSGLFAGVGESEAGEVGDFDFATVDGEAHGDECGEKRDHKHGERAENDVEEAVDPGDLHCLVRIYGESIFGAGTAANFNSAGIFAIRLTSDLEDIRCCDGHGERC
jgi:hypothetical protein